MRTYNELSSKEQTFAHEQSLLKMLSGIVEAKVCFPANKSLQDCILAARSDPARTGKPWFVVEVLLAQHKETIEAYAIKEAQRAAYRDAGDLIFKSC
jgi:hypothetical protein